MKHHQLSQIANDIIKSNIYLSLATTDDNNPWIAPLFYCTDDNFNFYFISQMNSLHTRHILKNPTVAFSIFDSHQPEGEGNGVQGSGKVHLLEKETEIKEALKWYSTTFIDCKPESFTGNEPYRLFKLTTNKLYILDPDAEVDFRVEVKL